MQVLSRLYNDNQYRDPMKAFFSRVLLLLLAAAIFFANPLAVLASAWSVSAASYDNKSKNVSAQLSQVTGVFFAPDGLTMYVIGGQVPADIMQYTLSTAWDVSTATYASKSYRVSGNAIYYPEGLFFKPDGTSVYVVSGYTNAVHQLTLSTPWDISTASYGSANISVSAQDAEASDIYFKSDGLKMYLSGNGGDAVYQYTLGTAWDITTASYDSVSFTVWSYTPSAGSTNGLFLKDDGTKMYTVDSSSDKIAQFSLGTPWDISTATHDAVDFSVASQSAVPNGIFIKPDGGKLYLAEYTGKTIYQYSLADTTAPTLSSVSPLDGSFNAGVTSTLSLTFSESVSTSTGNIYLKKSSNDATVETISVTSGQVSRSSSNVFIVDPSVTLEAETGYYITIDAGAITDTVGNAYAGISATTAWNFISENAAAVLTYQPTSITTSTAVLFGNLANIKGASPTARGFVYGTSPVDGSSWALTGSETAVSSVGTPAITGLTTSSIAFIDSTNDQLRTYSFSGDSWALTGSGLAVTSVNLPALASLSSTAVAFIDDTNDSLRAYTFNGSTWSLTGSGLSITTVTNPALAALSSTSVAFIDATNDSLRTYGFDGSTWSQTGSSLAISTVGSPALTALTSSTVAFLDSTNDSLRTYSFNGSTWSLLGSALAISTVGTPALSTLTTSTVAVFDTGNLTVRTYRFNGSAWSLVGSSAYVSSAGTAALAGMTSSSVAFIDSTNDKLRSYTFSIGNTSTSTSSYPSSIESSGSFSTGSYSESLSGLTGGTTYYARSFVQSSLGYVYGNEVTFTTDADTTPPTILDVDSELANGSYGIGQSIPVTVTFSEAVTSTGSVTLLFETGTTDQSCTFTVTNATTGTCTYVVQAGDSSADLTVQSVSGTITDSASNAMVFFTPLLNLADNKAIVIDTIAPVITLSGSASVSVSQGSGYADAGATASDTTDGDITGSIGTSGSVDTATVGSYTITYSVSDTAGNAAEPVVRRVTVTAVEVRSEEVVRNGGGAVAYQPVLPVALQNVSGGKLIPLALTVNGSALPTVQTYSSKIRLGFNADQSKVKGYAVSLRPDFKLASIYPYQSSIDYQLPDQIGAYTIYTKLFSTTGDASPVLKRSVEYLAHPVAVSDVVKPTSSHTSSSYEFTRNLRLGMEGDDVRELQKLLNDQGFIVATRGNGSIGKESTYFGMATVRALTRLQERYRKQVLDPLSLKKGTGNLFELTRTFLNEGFF